jgi:hypothetical protein
MHKDSVRTDPEVPVTDARDYGLGGRRTKLSSFHNQVVISQGMVAREFHAANCIRAYGELPRGREEDEGQRESFSTSAPPELSSLMSRGRMSGALFLICYGAH